MRTREDEDKDKKKSTTMNTNGHERPRTASHCCRCRKTKQTKSEKHKNKERCTIYITTTKHKKTFPHPLHIKSHREHNATELRTFVSLLFFTPIFFYLTGTKRIIFTTINYHIIKIYICSDYYNYIKITEGS